MDILQLGLEHTWRWFGPNDPISLSDIQQTGATGIVTALHHLPNGAVWPVEDIKKRKSAIEAEGLKWSVVESVPVHEEIKTGGSNRSHYLENYKETLRNLGACGIDVVCYNFMPVLDWTRTDLAYKLDNGSLALRLDIRALRAFDLFILQRPNAKTEYTHEEQKVIKNYFDHLTKDDKVQLTKNILAGLPGSEEEYTVEEFKKVIKAYARVGHKELRENLVYFLKEVIPVAEQSNVKMAIHPDDPPFDLFGLPRVVSTADDFRYLFEQVPSRFNGLTFCSGSLGVREDNDLVDIINSYGDRIHFAHLRSTKREPDGSFYEANHLLGDVDMYEILTALLKEQYKRLDQTNDRIPMRPDHGHQLFNDGEVITNPGYSLMGRMKGLAELRGLELGILKSVDF